MKKYLGTMTGLLLANYAFAFPCFITLAKDSCWDGKEVTMNVWETSSNKKVVTVKLGAKEWWSREIFECKPHEILRFDAQFSPVFWQDDQGKVYPGHSYWTLPTEAKPDEKAWSLQVCFAKDFIQVPLPPEAKGNCTCNFEQIPSIKPM
jgi:hypothetical protein